MSLLLEPYNPQWKTAFEQLRQTLLQLLSGLPVIIEQVGSTSIPGMYAKPILDIDIILHAKELLSTISYRLETAGYINKGEQGIPERFAFAQSNAFTPHTGLNETKQEHHLYVCFSGSLALKNHLRFRDALIQQPELAAQYIQLKKELRNEQGMTRPVYNQRKTDFILSVLAMNGFTDEELLEIQRANK